MQDSYIDPCGFSLKQVKIAPMWRSWQPNPKTPTHTHTHTEVLKIVTSQKENKKEGSLIKFLEDDMEGRQRASVIISST